MLGEEMDLRRSIEHLKALAGGYFWLPCPICGEFFGGHEESGSLMDDYSSGRMVCINCKPEADKRNKELMEYYQKNFHRVYETGEMVPNVVVTTPVAETKSI